MFLGIEIGGTKLQLGVGRGDGATLPKCERRDVEIAKGASGILDQIESTAAELLAGYPVSRIGIGFGGPVDASSGRVIKSHQVAGWDGFPLTEWCEQKFGLPTRLGNDCDCAALAEAKFGAGRGSRVVFYVTVGTGIGGGLVINQQLHGSGRPAVAEIGHLRPGVDAIDPGRTVESLAAGPGIVWSARRLLDACTDGTARQSLFESAGDDPSNWTARQIAEAAASGNPIASEALASAVQTLGWAIAQTITLTAAEAVVVGGGVALIGEQRFFQPLRRHVEEYVFPALSGAYRVVPAELGEAVVVHGALALAAI